MSQIQRTTSAQPRKLFKYYIDKNTANDTKENPFFYRMNRFRFNSYNQNRFMKWAKLRNPLLFSMGVSIVYNWAFHTYEPVPEGH